MPTASPDPTQLEAEGYRLLGQDDLASAAQVFAAAINGNGGLGKSWHGLGVALLGLGRADSFLNVAHQADQLFESEVAYGVNVLLDLVSRNDGYAVLESILNQFPSNNPVTALAIYHAGCGAMQRGDKDTAFEHFLMFRKAVLENSKLYPVDQDRNMNIMFRQAYLIEPPKVVGELESISPDSIYEYAPDLNFSNAPFRPDAPDGPVFLSCCNGIYFDHFADALAASVVKHCGDVILHLHVAEPGEDLVDRIEHLRAIHPALKLNVSTESETAFSGNVYFACNRFLLVQDFIDFYESGVTILDVDGTFNTDPMPLIEAAKGSDVACFNSGRTEPASVYQAAYVTVQANDAAMRFTSLLRRFILSKLHEPPGLSWMLDQAALFSVFYYLQSDSRSFRLLELNKGTGYGYGDFIDTYDDEAGKLELMRQATV